MPVAVLPVPVSLSLRGTQREYTNWDRYHVVLDMLHPGSPWTFSLWRGELDTTAWRTFRSTIRLWDVAEIRLGGGLVCNGYMDERKTGASRGDGAAIVVGGQDMASEATGWDADPRISLRNAALEDILSRLFQALGLSVVMSAAASEVRRIQQAQRPGARGLSAHRSSRRRVHDQRKVQPGEKVWHVAERLAKLNGYLVWVGPNAEGGLSVIVDAPAYASDVVFQFQRREVDGVVTADSNIKEGWWTLNGRGVPMSVRVYGTGGHGDRPQEHWETVVDNDGVVLPQVAALLPTRVEYLRPRRARTQAAQIQAGQHRIAESMRGFSTYACLVEGHGQRVNGSARIYAPNTMARVRDDLAGVDEDMLIQRVEYLGGRTQGQFTQLVLGRRNQIQIFPEET